MKRNFLLFLSVITAIIITTVSSGCVPRKSLKPISGLEDCGNTITAQPPEECDPMAHSGIENLSYIAYNLKNTNAYTVKSNSTVNTKVVISYTQTVECYKDHKDGITVVSDISKSTLVNTALQTCFANNRAMWRKPLSNHATDWNGKNTEWKSEPPTNYSYEEYKTVYGLPADEFSLYILNEETVTRWSDVTDNGDGTYSQTFYPDTESSSKPYSVKMRTMGGLADLPRFNSIALTYTFTKDWKVLKCETTENYHMQKGLITSDNCTAFTTDIYSYDESLVDISAYYDFFKDYIDEESDASIVEEKELTAVDYLSAAFGDILSKPAQLAIDAQIDGMDLQVKAYLDLSSNDIRIDAGFASIYYNGHDVYAIIEDKHDVKLDINAVKNILADYDLPELDTDSLLDELCAGELIKTQDGATLSSKLSLSGITLPLTFEFSGTKADEIALDNAKITNLKIADREINATIRFDKEENFLHAIDEQTMANAADLSEAVNTVYGLAMADALHVAAEVTMDSDKLPIDITIDCDLSFANGLSFCADINCVAAGTNCYAKVQFSQNKLYVSFENFGCVIEIESLEDLEEKLDYIICELGEIIGTQIELPQAETLSPKQMITAIIDGLGLSNAGENNSALSISFGANVNIEIGNGIIDVAANVQNAQINARLTKGEHVEYVEFTDLMDEADIKTLLSYAKAIKNEILADMWDAQFEMTVNAEAGELSQTTQFDVSGTLRVKKPTEKTPFSADIRLKVLSTDENSKNYIVGLTIVGEDIYVSASYYEPDHEDSAPLYLTCTTQTLSSLLQSVQTLKGLDLSFIEGLLPSEEEVQQNDITINDYISKFAINEGEVHLGLSGTAIYKNENARDIQLAIAKDDQNRIESLSAQNITYQTQPESWIDAQFTFSHDGFDIEVPDCEFIDISTIDRFINSAVSSFATVSDSSVYLLDNYYFSGKASCVIDSYKLQFDVAINLDIKGMTITATIGADSKFAINQGKYLTYMTIDFKNNLIYMMREQYEYYSVIRFKKYSSPHVTYRAMTTEEFGNDYLNQIFYMTNMGDVLTKIVKGLVPAPNGEDKPLYDIGTYVKHYAYNADENYYNLVINGNNLSSAINDMDLKLKCNDNDDIVKIVGTVDVSVTLAIDIDYENITSPDNYKLNIADLKQLWNVEGKTIRVLTGKTNTCTKLEDIICYE